jgi:hypothetical protein
MGLTTALRTSLAHVLQRCAAVTAQWAARLTPPPTTHADTTVRASVTTGGPPAHWVEKVRAAAPHLLEPAPPMLPLRPELPPRPATPMWTVADRGTERQRAPVPYHPEPTAAPVPPPPEPASEGDASVRITNDAPDGPLVSTDAQVVRNTTPSADSVPTARDMAVTAPVARPDATDRAPPAPRAVTRLTLPLRHAPSQHPTRTPETAPQARADAITPVPQSVATPEMQQSPDRDTPPSAEEPAVTLARETVGEPIARPHNSPPPPRSVGLDGLSPAPRVLWAAPPRPGQHVETVIVADRRHAPAPEARPAFPDLVRDMPHTRSVAPSPVAWDTPRSFPEPVHGQASIEDYWPALPDMPAAADPHALLREWERARRLEREQRGT